MPYSRSDTQAALDLATFALGAIGNILRRQAEVLQELDPEFLNKFDIELLALVRTKYARYMSLPYEKFSRIEADIGNLMTIARENQNLPGSKADG